jgi:3-phenylpropionate/cinnamic acid dioxygenase small subunit
MQATDVRSDEAAITRVLLDYCGGIDRRDWATFQRCFAEECRADYGPIGTWSSAEEITAWMRVSHADMGATMHRLSNVTVDVDGDQAQARSYVDAVLLSGHGDGGTQALGFYDDRLRRTGGAWKIAERTFTMVLQRELQR